MVKPNSRSRGVLFQALRRSARRRTERGAAVFIVVMAIVLLTGIGIFAVRTASMVDVAAGYDRQAAQTYHLSEYAGRAAASLTSGTKEVLRMQLLNDPTAQIPFEEAVLAERVTQDSSNPLFVAPAATVAGSFGPPVPAALVGRSAVPEGRMRIFISDASDHELTPGEEAGKDPPLEVTITAIGQIRPTPVGGPDSLWCTTTDASGAASVQSLRSHVTIIK